MAPLETVPTAEATCEAAVSDGERMGISMPAGTKLVASFGSTESRVDRWKVRMAAAVGANVKTDPEEASTAANDRRIDVCHFDGDFGRPRGDPPESVPNDDRVVVLAPEAKAAMLFIAGFQKTLPILDPNSE